MKQKRSTKSLVPEGGITSEELEPGTILFLDKKIKVTVISQRILKNYTTVSDGKNSFEVATNRLTKIKKY